MYINAIGHYIPALRIDNNYFKELNGLDDEWIFPRTGIKTRSRMSEGENGHTMGLAAVENALATLPYPIETVDLIIHASYSPLDTVGTLAHVVQQKYQVAGAKAFYISSACSSFVNAVEIVQSFFQTGKATRALVIATEQNSLYSHDNCEKSGHLWGDAAAAMFISKDPVATANEPRIIDTFTRGLGHVGCGPDGVYLQPGIDGLQMPDGRDVFQHACEYMVEALRTILTNNNLSINDLNYIIPHQANQRIV
ncbi:MAG: ketoacyl-ACP synthase III, partial [Prevotellaceae bacterium]|nr:ketoacyl-ACP synthase III [Prevotellaceae bacterium]